MKYDTIIYEGKKMGLFNWNEKFNETIFLKKDSELEKKIKVLEDLKNDEIFKERVEEDLLLAKLGLKGEQEIEFELKNSNIGMFVLHDISIKYDDLSAQVDYVVVTPAKTYFIECKNLVGDITINERGDFIRQFKYKNKNIKEGIYSPLRQAERHIEIYHKLWSLTNNGIFSNIREKNFNFWYVPLVVTANSKNVLKTNFAPKSVKNYVIRSDQLIRYIQNDIDNTDKDYLSNESEMRQIAEKILSYNQPIKVDYKSIYSKSNNNINNFDIKLNVKYARKYFSEEFKYYYKIQAN